MPVRDHLSVAKRRLMKYPFFPAINMPFRAYETGRAYIFPVVANWTRWVFQSRADANFTYNLTDRCRTNLAAGLSGILDVPFETLLSYFREIEEDQAFNTHIFDLWQEHPERFRTDRHPHVGRRMVWYAVARSLKPKVIIETGVDQGMGAVVLCAALLRNAAEGHPGRYFGTDINPNAGFYLKPPYSSVGQILYGDSIQSLRAFADGVDLFINDSDHSADYEADEYDVIKGKLSQHAIVLGDNSHVTPKLAEFSMREGRRFVFLAEEPANHWYRGAGIGVSWKPD